VKELTAVIGLVLVMCLLMPVSCTCSPTTTQSEVQEQGPTVMAVGKEPGIYRSDPAEPSPPAPGILGLTEEQQELWVERGVVPVATIEEASRMTGYQVATPGFLPVDYLVGCFQLSQLGHPPQLGGEWGDGKIVVHRNWSWQGPGGGSVFLNQFQGTEESVGGEPFEVCGYPGKREFHEADREYPLLVLHWWDGEMVYSLGGVLAAPLTEDVLLKIACSVH